MFPASTKGGGMASIPGPLDACKTTTPGGPIPMPYPNLSDVSNATDCAEKTKFSGGKVCTTKSSMTRSNGDEVGTIGGIVSNRNMADVKFKMGSSKVIVEGEKCIHVGSMTGHNGSNANMPAGAQVAPSQTKVLVGP